MFPSATSNHHRIYVYEDKSYIIAAVSPLPSGKQIVKIKNHSRVKEWEDLSSFLPEYVYLTEGDIASLSGEDFISYMEVFSPNT